jgi:hypothetical protein
MAGWTSSPIYLGLQGFAEAILHVDETHVCWGDNITGSLQLKGLRGSHRITQPITARLEIEHEDGDIPGSIVRFPPLSPEAITLGAGTVNHLRFSYRIPWGTPFQDRIRLLVTMTSGTWSQWNQSLGVYLHPQPPSPCSNLASILAEAGRMRVERWVSHHGSIQATLHPTAKPHRFRSMELVLEPYGNDWHGHLILQRGNRLLTAPICLGVPPISFERGNASQIFTALLKHVNFRPPETAALPVPAERQALARHELPLPAHPTPPAVVDLPSPSGFPSEAP